MKYILTEDGKISDVEEFISKVKQNNYYKDYEFEPIEFVVGKPVEIRWTAVGTKENSSDEQREQKCQYAASTSYPLVKAANTIEELCDEFVEEEPQYDGGYKYWILPQCQGKTLKTVMSAIKDHLKDGDIYGAVWIHKKGLIYVAKMNEKGELELL